MPHPQFEEDVHPVADPIQNHTAIAGFYRLCDGIGIIDIDKCIAVKYDNFVKCPDAALRCVLRRCGVPKSTPHASGFALLIKTPGPGSKVYN